MTRPPLRRQPALFDEQEEDTQPVETVAWAGPVKVGAKAKNKANKPQRSASAIRLTSQIPQPEQPLFLEEAPMQYGYPGEVCESCNTGGGYACDVSCGMAEPSCGICEPSCGCGEPSCGICEPACGMAEPTCSTCVVSDGPDWWCFPVCLPRLKYLDLTVGVEGFRGSRDFIGGASDSNFGFNEGFSIGGRAPIVSFFYPEISYQIGYRAVQSRLFGTVADANGRSQQFLTAGLFRRTDVGIQFGAAFDLMTDNLTVSDDFHQMRYEISIKSNKGREFGFWGATHTNSVVVGGNPLQTVDQYVLFYRWRIRQDGEGRFWGGVSDDSEGIFGGEFNLPLSDRWSLQTGFNFLIPDAPAGNEGVSEEAWNVGLNLVWHWGGRARSSMHSPFRPLFNTADNGTMFVDIEP